MMPLQAPAPVGFLLLLVLQWVVLPFASMAQCEPTAGGDTGCCCVVVELPPPGADCCGSPAEEDPTPELSGEELAENCGCTLVPTQSPPMQARASCEQPVGYTNGDVARARVPICEVDPADNRDRHFPERHAPDTGLRPVRVIYGVFRL